MPLPHNISIAIYPGKCVLTVGCATTQESSCLKSSIGQLLMWTSGLLFSKEKTADYSLSSCMQHATYSGVKQLSGKTKTTWNRSALVEVSCGYQSQPLALCSNSFGLFDFSQVQRGSPLRPFPRVLQGNVFQPLAVPRLKNPVA